MWPSTLVLFAATFLMGVGIAVSQRALPALVRQWYPARAARATGVWSNGLLVGEMLSTSLTLPVVLPLVGGDWRASLPVWTAPVVLTVMGFALGTPPEPAEAGFWRGAGWPDRRDGRVLHLGFLRSAACLIYFGANTFIPHYLHQTGRRDAVGLALAVLNTAQIPASLVIGLVPWRLLSRPAASVSVGVLVLLALAAMLTREVGPVLVAAVVLGFAAAYILVLSFAIPALLAGPHDVSRVLSGGFAVGYTTAFAVTVAAGGAWDASHAAAFALAPGLLGAILVTLIGPRLLSQTPVMVEETASAKPSARAVGSRNA